MKRTLIAAIALGTIVLGVPMLSYGNDPCHRKEFKTELIKDACAVGGQKAAKDAMKKFVKDHKLEDCDTCHAKMGPSYELKADGLEQFRKLGGK